MPRLTFAQFPESCPFCGVSWLGEPITDIQERARLGGAAHERTMLYTYDSISDQMRGLRCPSCGGELDFDEVRQAASEHEV